MDISKLLIDSYRLLCKAQTNEDLGFEDSAIKSLVKLRELLNSQPELEAGGACESAEHVEDENTKRNTARNQAMRSGRP